MLGDNPESQGSRRGRSTAGSLATDCPFWIVPTTYSTRYSLYSCNTSYCTKHALRYKQRGKSFGSGSTVVSPSRRMAPCLLTAEQSKLSQASQEIVLTPACRTSTRGTRRGRESPDELENDLFRIPGCTGDGLWQVQSSTVGVVCVD